MRRDEAWEFHRLGVQVERGDMTTRVLDVLAGNLLDAPESAIAFAEVRWMSVLRSLSALQMFHRATLEPVSAPAALRFLLFDQRFPRALSTCLVEVELGVSRLPRGESVLAVCGQARRRLGAVEVDSLDAARLHDVVDDLQVAIGAVHDRIAATWFPAIPAVV
jgi:uncharacterized alpha-E superfamily protein